MKTRIYIEKRECYQYPNSNACYSPNTFYPEYPFSRDTLSTQQNEVYDMVRTSLFGLGFDAERYGTNKWNPLGEYVNPGARILLKPNWVYHKNPAGALECMVTHPSVIRCIIDYCVIAKVNMIEIGDTPMQNCNINILMKFYDKVFEFAKMQKINLLISDFRIQIADTSKNEIWVLNENKKAASNETLEFDLKDKSCFSNLSNKFKNRYRIGTYSDMKLNERHNEKHNKYLIAKSFFDADLVINLPKPKTHRFGGITGAQKNFIGICSDKEYLPHFRTGTAKTGGDESNSSNIIRRLCSFFLYQWCKYTELQNVKFQILYSCLKRLFGKINRISSNKHYINGLWHGNDTIWRTILDINTLLLYGNKTGDFDFNKTPKTILSIGDMIIAGEKNGPLEPSPKPLGIILASDNCAVFDFVFCKIAGFDYNLIPTVKNSINDKRFIKEKISDIKIKSNLTEYSDRPIDNLSFPSEWAFLPNDAWDIL
jgi:uncharacterized protein (DUF362 family)